MGAEPPARPAETADVVPEILPELERYTILSKLASGGMASIYAAQRTGEDTLCVIKILHEHLAQDAVVGSRFLREAQVASMLDHNGIARLLDAGRERDMFYLAMEFIAGQDLETMMFKLMAERRMLPPGLSATISLDVLDGLHYAHEFKDADGLHLELVHRDMSPRNVMVTYEGDAKIIDFGLARIKLGEFQTAPGMVLGTLRYMSPEQAVAETVDFRSDLYSWGVVLYEMLSGRPLIAGETAQKILHTVVTEVPPPLSQLNPQLPEALDAVFERALAKSREERFQTALEFKEAFREAAGDLADTPRRQIGKFVSKMFPNARRDAEMMVLRARAGDFTEEMTRIKDSPEFIATRAVSREEFESQEFPIEAPGLNASTSETGNLPAPRLMSTDISSASAAKRFAINASMTLSHPNPTEASMDVRANRGKRSTTWAVSLVVVLLMLGGLGYFVIADQNVKSIIAETGEAAAAPGVQARAGSPGVTAKQGEEPAVPKEPTPPPARPKKATSIRKSRSTRRAAPETAKKVRRRTAVPAKPAARMLSAAECDKVKRDKSSPFRAFCACKEKATGLYLKSEKDANAECRSKLP